MYRSQYKDTSDAFQRFLQRQDTLNPNIGIKPYHRRKDHQHQESHSQFANQEDDFENNNDITAGISNNNYYLNCENTHEESADHNTSIREETERKNPRGLYGDIRGNPVEVDDSSESLDPDISIQDENERSGSSGESTPLQSEHPSLSSPTFKKRNSVDSFHFSSTQRVSIGEQRNRSPHPYSVQKDHRTSISSTNASGVLRRTSSLSSLPSHFYPDPYSIVFSRYLEDLGSLSPYSSASGSEATEYLSTPLSSPEKVNANEANRTKLEERKRVSVVRRESNGGGESFDCKMNFDSALSTSEEYQSFRSSVPLRKICVENDGSKEWKVYDAGPRTVRTPLLCLGPACATSDVFYRQILNLTARGIRVISVEGPVYWSVDDWCKGLKKLLDCLNLDKVHIFGASLGGFLAQKFAEYTYHYSRVASLILCNTFLDTSIFDYHDSAMIFWMLPSVILKKLIIENITAARIMDLEIAHAIEFMIERLNNLSQQELASRMTLNCVNSHVDTFKLKPIKITVMDVFDDSALSSQAREDIYRNYTDAKLAHLKSGGNFPYLSRSDEVNLHIMVHLRAFNGTKHSAQLEETVDLNKVNSGRNSRPISAHQRIGNSPASINNKNPEDVFGSTGSCSLPVSSVEDKNQAFKEEAATALGLPVQ